MYQPIRSLQVGPDLPDTPHVSVKKNFFVVLEQFDFYWNQNKTHKSYKQKKN